MKTIHAILLTVFCLLFAACAKDIKKALVNDFFAALEKGDFEEAKKLSTPETYKILAVVEKEYNENKEKLEAPKPIKIEIIDAREEEAKADYTVKIFIGDVVEQVVVPVVLVNNIWLVKMPREHITLLQFVTFHDQHRIIFKHRMPNGKWKTGKWKTNKVKTHKHGHAYGHGNGNGNKHGH